MFAMLNNGTYKKILIFLLCFIVLAMLAWFAYRKIYAAGYDKGKADGMAFAVAAYCQQNANTIVKEEAEKHHDSVSTGIAVNTTTTAKVLPKNENTAKYDVVVKTEKPKVTASVNGKEYVFDAKNDFLSVGNTTNAAISIKVPERKWSIGLGTDGRKAAYMVKAPIKGAVGVWIAGSGRDKVMGGLSISF